MTDRQQPRLLRQLRGAIHAVRLTLWALRLFPWIENIRTRIEACDDCGSFQDFDDLCECHQKTAMALMETMP